MARVMSENSYAIEVQADFLKRQAKAKPLHAVAEFIWNGLDADATRIDVSLEQGALGFTKITIRDNGRHFIEPLSPALTRRTPVVLSPNWLASRFHQ